MDVVIFTLQGEALQVLLVQRGNAKEEPYPGRWALPGGLMNVELDADLVPSARRILKDKTGVASPYIEQLGSWGSVSRDPRGWSATHVYFALVAAQAVKATKEANAADIGWFDVDAVLERGGLAFDHDVILEAALERLRSKAEYTSLPAFLVAEPFTLPQLQRATRSCWPGRWTRAGSEPGCLRPGCSRRRGMCRGIGIARRWGIGWRIGAHRWCFRVRSVRGRD